MYFACMTIQITIRNVPAEVRDELAVRAARRGQSMQEFLRGELERLATRPPVDELLAGMKARKAMSGTRVGADEILKARDADRK
jgi:plasmid stability protein